MLQVGKSDGGLRCFTASLLPLKFWEAGKAPEISRWDMQGRAGQQGLLSQPQRSCGSGWTRTCDQGPPGVSHVRPSVYTKHIWNLHRKLMESLVSHRFPWLYLLCIINVTKWVDEHFSVGVNRQGCLENEWTAKINCKAARLSSLVRDSEGSANPFIAKRFLY